MTNIKEFKQLLKLKQEELHDYLCEVMPSYFEEERIIDQYGSFLYCEGELPVILVAHLDTVHKTPPRNIFYDETEKIMWSPNGIGGDDRCGVWSILEVLDRGLRPSVVFTWNEECGGLGASDFCTVLDKEDLKDINLAIEIDRRGTMDCVFYDLDSADFESFIEEFNFKTAWGSFSDISTICPYFGFAGVNLSAGYFNEHTLQEYIDVAGMEYTIERTCNILKDDRINERWNFKEINYGQKYSSYSKIYGYGGYGNDCYGYDDLSEEDWKLYTNVLTNPEKTKLKSKPEGKSVLEWCANCSSLVEQVDMAPRPYDDMCLKCYEGLNITEEYCQCCGDLCKVEDLADYPNELICKKCYNELMASGERMQSKDMYCEVCHNLVDELSIYELKGKLVCRNCFEEN